MATVSDRVFDALSALEPEGDSDAKIARVVEGALVRRLHHYQYVDRHMQQKYGMTFDEFRDQRVVEQRGYSLDAESNFWEWELAIDGIATFVDRLMELRQACPSRHSRRCPGDARLI